MHSARTRGRGDPGLCPHGRHPGARASCRSSCACACVGRLPGWLIPVVACPRTWSTQPGSLRPALEASRSRPVQVDQASTSPRPPTPTSRCRVWRPQFLARPVGPVSSEATARAGGLPSAARGQARRPGGAVKRRRRCARPEHAPDERRDLRVPTTSALSLCDGTPQTSQRMPESS